MNSKLADQQICIQWVGDISLCGRFCSPHYHASIKTTFSQIIADAGPCDLRIGNFESPLWGTGGINELKVPRLCTTAEAAKCILPLKLDLVLTANNHIYDCREDGVKNTLAFFKENSIKTVGSGFSREEAENVAMLDIKGVSIAVVNFVDKGTNPCIPDNAGIFTNWLDRPRALEQVRQLAGENLVLVFLHCGDIEHIRLPSPSNREFARNLIDAGATLVAFDHAHCLGVYEKRDKGYINYGLGNFFFGDVNGEVWPELSRHTAIAQLKLVREQGRLEFKYYYSKANGLVLGDQKRQRTKHEKMSRRLGHSEKRYRLSYKLELFYQKVIVVYINFVKNSGGIIPSLLNIRKRHFHAVWRILRRRKKVFTDRTC